MRDITRIHRILSMVETVWNKFPDMRFFQFVSYFASMIFDDDKPHDLFYYEDDKLEDRLKEIVDKYKEEDYK